MRSCPNPMARVILAAAMLPALLAGCQTEAESRAASHIPYAGMTTGTPQARWAYVEQLSEQYREEEPTDPAGSRKLLLEFTGAVIETTGSILKDPAAGPEVREQAAGALLTAYGRRKQVDPESIPKLVEASRQIELENPKSRIGVIAAFERARVFRDQALASTEANVTEKVRLWGEEVLHLGQLTPSPSVVPKTLDELGQKTEFFGHTDLAEKLYRTLVDRFPEDENTPFAKGALYRMGLKGKPLTDLAGPGRNGKTVSIQDYKGKVVLVDFWATECKPCLEEMGKVEMLRQIYEPKGMTLLTVALDPNPQAVEKFLGSAKLDWTVIFSNADMSNMESPLTLRYGIKAIPFKMLIDQEGNLVASGYRLEEVVPALEKLLGPANAPETKAPAEPAAVSPEPAAAPKTDKKN